MNWLRNLPLRRQLTMAIVLSCSTVLLLACGILAVYQVIDFHQNMVRVNTVLADVLARNTQAALTFEDEAAARQTLAALQAEPTVAAARIYDVKGAPFADYVRDGATADLPDHPSPDGHYFGATHLSIFRQVELNDKRVGTICLEIGFEGLMSQLQLFAGIALLVLAGSVFVALLLSSQLQKPISGPILSLASISRLIAEEKDYTARVPSLGGHETGQMADALNQLLASIEERDRALRTANDSLRGEVTERKTAEEKVQSQLARLQLLHRITRAISERQDLKSIFQVVIRTLEDNLPLDFCSIGHYEPDAHAVLVVGVGTRTPSLTNVFAEKAQTSLDTAQNGLTRAILGTLDYHPDIRDTDTSPFFKQLAEAGLHSLVIAPLLAESRNFGLLFACRKDPNGFSSSECEFLKQLSEHVALAAHQAQLYEALHQAYDDLRQTQQAVMQQERLRALGQMASGIAHDINNAISPVTLYTESLLESEPGLSTRARQYLETIQRAIDDVAQTVSRMKEFYRQRETQLNLLPVQINSLVQHVLELSRARWSNMSQQRGVFIDVATDLAPDLPSVLGIESEIREALINLVFNAVDAMPDGGKLTLRTRPVASATTAPGSPVRRKIQVEVIDTGVGMDEDTRRRCLEPFFTTKGERGTGLGLAMVYGIAGRHGADVEIDSTVGKGTTFRIMFPVPSTAPASATPEMKAFVVPTRLRLLVVDDDPLLIKSLRDTLEMDGHQVTATTGGREGIETFRIASQTQEPFAAVITDLGMPYVNGREVAASIKGISPSTPVILLTGWGQRLAAEGDIPPHVDRVLSKPPRLREIREALAHLVTTKET